MEIHILETVEDLILQVEFFKTHKSVILIVKNSLSPLSFPADDPGSSGRGDGRSAAVHPAAGTSSPSSVAGVQPVIRTRT